jgi:hypothetical protein
MHSFTPTTPLHPLGYHEHAYCVCFKNMLCNPQAITPISTPNEDDTHSVRLFQATLGAQVACKVDKRSAIVCGSPRRAYIT